MMCLDKKRRRLCVCIDHSLFCSAVSDSGPRAPTGSLFGCGHRADGVEGEDIVVPDIHRVLYMEVDNEQKGRR